MDRSIHERILVPAREGRAVPVPAGGQFRVVDVEGQQVGDLFAFSARDVGEYASAEHTRVGIARLFPRVGEAFLTNRRRPILTLLAEDSPGVNDMLMAACDPERYRLLGVTGWHASCEENLRRAMAGLGHPSVEVPQPINLFMDVPIGPDGALSFRAAGTRPGDSVTLQAEMDAIVVLSACPQDLNPVNGPGPTSLAIDLLD
ncbi:MAG: hypothetical protein XU14_C0109G0003 [Armatimonadetes bacterium CSP1-3]|nr:MAG: hypothetical protein XU14_C0109G0003 [Armatimonadetes bacterium CSP1-3]